MFNKKLRYYKNKLAGIERMIWDLEFRRWQLSQFREEVRQQRDRVFENVDALSKKVAELPQENESYKVLSVDLETKQKSLEELERQMKMLDGEINGSNPEMEASVQARIDAAYELRNQWKEFIKTTK